MKRVRPAPLRARTKVDQQQGEDFSDNAVGSRSKGLEVDLHLREFEINQLTQRNNFFMIFQGVMIAGLVQSQGTAAPLITFSMALLGVTTSTLQIGMAGGAKYWQSRWEASTRSSEIAIVLELTRQKKLAVQTFTHDSSLLTEEERKQVADWNSKNSDPDDQITTTPNFIREGVMVDIDSGPKKGLRRYADWWVRRLAIAPKWSVSRIPIWIGAVLFLFWLVIAASSFRVTGFDPSRLAPSWFELVPLKTEATK